MSTTPDQLSRQLQPMDSFGNPVQLITLYELDLTLKGGPIYYFHDGIQTGEDFNDGASTINVVTFTSATAAFVAGDVGDLITGQNIKPGTLIAARNSATSINLSQTASATGTNLPFTIWARSASNQIVFKTHTYTPFPLRAEGFAWSTSGTLPRPHMTVSNIGSVTSALLRQYDDFIGATLVRRMTFSNYIQGGSEPDDTKEFTPQIFVVDRKTAETSTICSFELATGMDAEGILLPRRQILATACPWIYRGPECTYTGVPKTKRDGTTFVGPLVDRGAWSSATTYAAKDYAYLLVGGVRVYAVSKVGSNLNHSIYDMNFWDLDVCLKKHSDCDLHFTVNPAAGLQTVPNGLPYGGFLGASKVQ